MVGYQPVRLQDSRTVLPNVIYVTRLLHKTWQIKSALTSMWFLSLSFEANTFLLGKFYRAQLTSLTKLIESEYMYLNCEILTNLFVEYDF